MAGDEQTFAEASFAAHQEAAGVLVGLEEDGTFDGGQLFA